MYGLIISFVFAAALVGCAPTPPPLPAAGPWFTLNDQTRLAGATASPHASELNREAGR